MSSSFIDPSCVSSLVPSPGENVVECQARIGGQDKLGTLFFLQADEVSTRASTSSHVCTTDEATLL
jgi:hypothetical protein